MAREADRDDKVYGIWNGDEMNDAEAMGVVPSKPHSIVERAFENARKEAIAKLVKDGEAYFQGLVNRAAYLKARLGSITGAVLTMEEVRAEVLEKLEQFNADLVTERSELDVEVKQFDHDAKEIGVWYDATKAAGRVAASARNSR